MESILPNLVLKNKIEYVCNKKNNCIYYDMSKLDRTKSNKSFVRLASGPRSMLFINNILSVFIYYDLFFSFVFGFMFVVHLLKLIGFDY